MASSVVSFWLDATTHLSHRFPHVWRMPATRSECNCDEVMRKHKILGCFSLIGKEATCKCLRILKGGSLQMFRKVGLNREVSFVKAAWRGALQVEKEEEDDVGISMIFPPRTSWSRVRAPSRLSSGWAENRINVNIPWSITIVASNLDRSRSWRGTQRLYFRRPDMVMDRWIVLDEKPMTAIEAADSVRLESRWLLTCSVFVSHHSVPFGRFNLKGSIAVCSNPKLGGDGNVSIGRKIRQWNMSSHQVIIQWQN